MGANAFGTGAAEIDPDVFAEPIVDNSGLALELRGREAFSYGEPVVVELKLSTTDLRGRATHGYLHPNDDLVSIAIRQPSGRVVLYQPLLRHCVDEDRRVRLDAERAGPLRQRVHRLRARRLLLRAAGPLQLRAATSARTARAWSRRS